jgi:two-component system chemotaxis response regulator CheY
MFSILIRKGTLMRFCILCVDEFGLTRLEFSCLLKKLDINFISVRNEIEACNILKEKKSEINAVIWTINTMDFDDFEEIKRIKDKDAYKHIPFIVVSRFTNKKYIIKAVEAGAVEYIAKPYDESAVLKKMYKILGVPYDKSAVRIDEDIVTFNFYEMLNKEIKAASRGSYPMSIMLVSLIPEKPEEATHESVKDLLALVSKVMKTKLRETDTIFNYSINNLITLLPFADTKGAKTVENKIHDIFCSHSLIGRKSNGYRLITASITYPDHGKIKDKLLEKLENDFNDRLKSTGIFS